MVAGFDTPLTSYVDRQVVAPRQRMGGKGAPARTSVKTQGELEPRVHPCCIPPSVCSADLGFRALPFGGIDSASFCRPKVGQSQAYSAFHSGIERDGEGTQTQVAGCIPQADDEQGQGGPLFGMSREASLARGPQTIR